jgi:UDP-N-acetylglucosamine 2-epimerase (non-hydrolysing)
MRILNVVGARPNFMKIAPILRAVRRVPSIEATLVHTGQHYDDAMAGQFFKDLDLPMPAVSLSVGSGSHAHQTAEVMKRLEPVLHERRPHVVVVVGDVNSTLGAAITAVKLGIPVAHVEAGLRSFDRSMPEEINRLLTDAISSYLFVTEDSARENLLREGIDADKIHMVGNVMIDSLEHSRLRWERADVARTFGLARGAYGVVTLHRPSNVDDAATLRGLVKALGEIARIMPLLFPVHPRTRDRLEAVGAIEGLGGDIRYARPLGYLDFLAVVAGARLVLTDSGGLQEETTALGVPCLTLREQTERPVTVTHGTNHIVGTSPGRIVDTALRVLSDPRSTTARPALWDGKSAERIVDVLCDAWTGGRLSPNQAAR